MGSIVLLDENTINKIAAGEVVDRPSAIVKELVENSIDAKAKNITVEIKRGGISFIKVQDDGIGFKSDDVEIAFERHATSKIRQEADILKVTSMGFRGEALASIAAISKVSLTTKNIDEEIGSNIIVEGGNIISFNKAASKKGSTIIIKDVFYNTPARFKFLKKDYTEAGYIEDSIIRIAIANPNVSLKYISNGKTIINTNGDGNLKDVVYSIFGKQSYEDVLLLNYEYENMKVSGVIGKASLSRSTRTNEYTYINNRYVKNKTMTSAIEKAYNEKLGIGKFPFAIINIKVRPETIDVNVHPAKLEVKFENESKVFEAIYSAVKNRLNEENKRTNPFTVINEEIKQEKIEQPLFNNNINLENEVNNIQGIKESNIDYSFDFKFNDKIKEQSQKQEEKSERTNNIINQVEEKQENIFKEVQSEIENSKVLYKYIGLLFNTYIIIEIEDKMYVIDQHACHERLLYEKFKKAFKTKEKETQILMIPLLIELKNNEVEVVDNNLEYFKKCGYLIEKFTDNSFKINGVPNVSNINLDDKSIFMDIIDELKGAEKTELKEKEFRFLATVACKAAIKANMNMDIKEHMSLIDGMLELENPFTCPHGRPIAFEMSKKELEKKVDRR